MADFKDLGVREAFIKGLHELGISKPTEIQQAVIPVLINNDTDLIGQAQTGTGKTAAYGLPLLHIMDPTQKKIQGLVLCPTRELGQQIAKQLFKFTKYSEKIFTEGVFGGLPIDRQISALRRPTHIVVATPGRLIDLLNRKALDLSTVKTVVLDEADEMLSMGFKKELDTILNTLSSSRNTWLFSATIPNGIQHIINDHLSENAEKIEVNPAHIVNRNITHQYKICKGQNKWYALLDLIDSKQNNRGVIFCTTKMATQKLAEQLIENGISAGAIHGDLKQKERDKVMRAFKSDRIQFLVATDLAARGIDVEGLSFVVHYQLPDNSEYYTHRSGRTARAGKAGRSICLIDSTEKEQLLAFERSLGIQFDELN